MSLMPCTSPFGHSIYAESLYFALVPARPFPESLAFEYLAICAPLVVVRTSRQKTKPYSHTCAIFTAYQA